MRASTITMLVFDHLDKDVPKMKIKKYRDARRGHTTKQPVTSPRY